jgi:3-oxoacyl-[acyl-carrier-protein] synthase III
MNTNGKFRDAIVHAFVVDGKPQRDWYRGEGSVRLASFAPEMGRETGALQIDFCREAAGGALAIAEKTAKDVRLFLGPQSVVWLNGALAAGLGFTKEQTIDTFTEVGNISPATLAFNLQAADQRGMLSDGDLVLAYSPGAGLTRAAVLFRWWSPKKNNA